MKWAVDNFKSWLGSRNSSVNEEEKCPETLLEDMNSIQLNKWLSIFVAETRKVNGQAYLPPTLHPRTVFNFGWYKFRKLIVKI